MNSLNSRVIHTILFLQNILLREIQPLKHLLNVSSVSESNSFGGKPNRHPIWVEIAQSAEQTATKHASRNFQRLETIFLERFRPLISQNRGSFRTRVLVDAQLVRPPDHRWRFRLASTATQSAADCYLRLGCLRQRCPCRTTRRGANPCNAICVFACLG